jgi:large subunit ribosomal protein L6
MTVYTFYVKNISYSIDRVFNKLTLKGPLGLVNLKLSNSLLKHITDRSFFFVKNSLKTFISNFSNSLVGVFHGFYVRLEIFGLGYKIIPERTDLTTLCFDLGCTHWIFYRFNLSENIFSVVRDKVIYVYGLDLALLNSRAAEIRNIRYLVPYKPKGIKFVNEILKIKQLKQK